MDMRTRDREYLNAEAGRRLESMLQRMGQWAVKVQEFGVMVPNMPHWETCAGLRRKIERLRAGKVRGLDPGIPPQALIKMMELMIEKETLTRSVVAEMDENRDIEQRINEKLDAERFRRSVASFHTLKKSPEAANPDSPVAEKVRQIHRARKKEMGRGRKRKG
jgi:hypothetical protein